MANVNIPDLSAGAPLDEADLLEVVQGGVNKKLTGAQLKPNLVVNAQTGATYTYVAADKGKLVTHTRATAVAATLPTAATMLAGFSVSVTNLGAGLVTITSASNINGETTLALATGHTVKLASDGANWFIASRFSTGYGTTGETALPVAADADSVLESGLYTLSTSSQHGPLSAEEYTLINLPVSGAVITQIATKTSGTGAGKLYTRYLASGVWSAWAEIGAGSGGSGSTTLPLAPTPPRIDVYSAGRRLDGVEVTSGILMCHTYNGTPDLQFNSAIQIETALGTPPVNSYFDMVVQNIQEDGLAGAPMILSMFPGSNNGYVTLVGNMLIPINTSAEFRLIKTAYGEWTAYRIS